MNGVKIKIECDDPLLAAAVAASITAGLERDDFSNVNVKCVMAYQNLDRHNFTKINVLGHLDQDRFKDQHNYVTEMYPASLIKLHPICVDNLRTIAPWLLKTPVLLDPGVEAPEYVTQERKFLKGEER
ncbi:hypothetical protein [Burkholderia phage FLC9]|nr:hypothetical protein [Burkholderia phage FLC9]